MVTASKLLFGFVLLKGTIDAVFILRKLPEEHCDKGIKLYVFCKSGKCMA